MRQTLKLKKASTKIVVDKKKTETLKSAKSATKQNPYFPTRYSTFRKNFKDYQIDQEATTALMRFIYRFRFAKAFKSINYKEPKYLDKTLQSYEACNGLFLAYTAFECVRKAASNIGLSPKFYDSLEIEPIMAERFRTNEKLISFLISIAKEAEQKDKLKKFIRKNAPSNDILDVIYMIRNAFGHGSFTPRGCGLDKKYHIEDLNFLTETLLEHADVVFQEAVERCQQFIKVAK